MKFAVAIAALVQTAFVSAATWTVAVGENGGLTFDPTTVMAAVNDTINFQFRAKNHTVTQSTFADPCQIMTTPKAGIDSNFQPVTANATMIPQWSITVDNASAPLWFFCKQTGHCAQGMVFAVNPTPEKTFAMFQAAAMGNTSATNGSTSASSSSTSAESKPSASTVGSASGAIRGMGMSGVGLIAAGLAAGLML